MVYFTVFWREEHLFLSYFLPSASDGLINSLTSIIGVFFKHLAAIKRKRLLLKHNCVPKTYMVAHTCS